MAMTPPSQYLLRWNDYLTNYGDILFSLREQEEYVDCSIACEDGVVGAHRVVLAGCSPYLRDLFSRVSNPHPVIFLLNTPRSLVLMLMEFIYRGQVHIPQHRLQQLVILGQALKIKGLNQILVPPSMSSSTSSDHASSITPLAFPHGLPLTTHNPIPFTAIPTSVAASMDISIFSCDNEQESEEDISGENKVDEKEETEEAEKCDENRNVTPRRRRGRPRVRPIVTKARVRVSCKKPALASKGYPISAREKVLIAEHAVCHGIDAAKSLMLEKYDVRTRQGTLERLIKWYREYQKSKERKARVKRQQALHK